MADPIDLASATKGDDPAVAYTETERAMIDCALRWVNHGGGPDEYIDTRFEMTSREVYREVVAILDRDLGRAFRHIGLSPVMVTRIKAVARRRIWLSE